MGQREGGGAQGARGSCLLLHDRVGGWVGQGLLGPMTVEGPKGFCSEPAPSPTGHLEACGSFLVATGLGLEIAAHPLCWGPRRPIPLHQDDPQSQGLVLPDIPPGEVPAPPKCSHCPVQTQVAPGPSGGAESSEDARAARLASVVRHRGPEAVRPRGMFSLTEPVHTCAVPRSSGGPHVAIDCWKCGSCDKDLNVLVYVILIHLKFSLTRT